MPKSPSSIEMCWALVGASVLFFALSPGVLLTIPAGKRGLLCSGQTSIAAAAVHAIVFLAVLYVLSMLFKSTESFSGCQKGSPCGYNAFYDEACNCSEQTPAYQESKEGDPCTPPAGNGHIGTFCKGVCQTPTENLNNPCAPSPY